MSNENARTAWSIGDEVIFRHEGLELEMEIEEVYPGVDDAGNPDFTYDLVRRLGSDDDADGMFAEVSHDLLELG